MNDQYIVVSGAWVDAIGTIISAIAEIRELAGINEVNNVIVAIGEGLQFTGGAIASTIPEEVALNFSGGWIDAIGAGATSLSAYFQHLDEEKGNQNIQLGILGDGFQSLGSFMSAIAQYEAGKENYAFGDGIQGVGAGLETLAGVFDLRETRIDVQPIVTLGAILQAIGQNYIAVLETRELMELQE